MEESVEDKKLRMENAKLRSELERLELLARKRSLEASLEEEEKRRRRVSSVIKLNVGGVVHSFSRDTCLSRFPRESLLWQLVREDASLGQGVDEEGALFVERDGERFRVIADYLRGTAVHDLVGVTPATRSALRADADYFGLPELATGLRRSYDPFALELREQEQRAERIAFREKLRVCRSDGVVAAAQKLDEDFLICLEDMTYVPFDEKRLNGLPLLFAEERKPREILQMPTPEQMLRRLDAFSGGVLEAIKDPETGRFPEHLFFAGGAVSACLQAGRLGGKQDKKPETSSRFRIENIIDDDDDDESQEESIDEDEAWEDALLRKLQPEGLFAKNSDVDCFLVGGPESDAACVALVDTITDRLYRYFESPILVTRTARCITFMSSEKDDPRRHLQLILKRFMSAGDVLKGFDIDACQVGFFPNVDPPPTKAVLHPPEEKAFFREKKSKPNRRDARLSPRALDDDQCHRPLASDDESLLRASPPKVCETRLRRRRAGPRREEPRLAFAKERGQGQPHHGQGRRRHHDGPPALDSPLLRGLERRAEDPPPGRLQRPLRRSTSRKITRLMAALPGRLARAQLYFPQSRRRRPRGRRSDARVHAYRRRPRSHLLRVKRQIRPLRSHGTRRENPQETRHLHRNSPRQPQATTLRPKKHPRPLLSLPALPLRSRRLDPKAPQASTAPCPRRQYWRPRLSPHPSATRTPPDPLLPALRRPGAIHGARRRHRRPHRRRLVPPRPPLRKRRRTPIIVTCSSSFCRGGGIMGGRGETNKFQKNFYEKLLATPTRAAGHSLF